MAQQGGKKAVLIMTDGKNTTYDFGTHLKTYITAYGFGIEERMGENIDTQSEMQGEFNNKFLRICQRMKAEGIQVYTIMFDLNDQTTEDIFKACATKPTQPYFFKSPSGTDLENAFGDIAQDLVKLHISK